MTKLAVVYDVAHSKLSAASMSFHNWHVTRSYKLSKLSFCSKTNYKLINKLDIDFFVWQMTNRTMNTLNIGYPKDASTTLMYASIQCSQQPWYDYVSLHHTCWRFPAEPSNIWVSHLKTHHEHHVIMPSLFTALSWGWNEDMKVFK